MKLNQTFHRKLLNWYGANNRSLPWRDHWSQFKDPWFVWVSEIMLQQTVIKAVIPVYQSFMAKYPTPQELARASTEEVRLAVRGLGYYRRFDALHRATQHLVTKNPFQWPQTFEQWKALPGIGDYTAAAISSITQNAPHGVVDGNVERVMCRIFDLREPPNSPHLKKQFKTVMDDLVQKGDPGSTNQAVMELGQRICTPSPNPSCSLCPVRGYCSAKKNISQHLAPQAKKKIPVKEIDAYIVIPITKTGEIGLFKRSPSAKFLKSTYGFPLLIKDKKQKWIIDGFGSTQGEGTCTPIHQETGKKKKIVGSYLHTITNHRLHIKVVTKVVSPLDQNSEMKYLHAVEAESQLVSNMDRKALKHILNQIHI
jgi:A/G-specific adenine glycosylase